MRTPATTALDAAGVAYELCEYDHDPASDSFGVEAATALGLDPNVVFKTLVAALDGGGSAKVDLVVAVVSVADRLDLKALARAAGAKRAHMAEVATAERATGYVAGGISPFGQRKPLATYVDDTAVLCDCIYVSGGQRGLDLAVAPSDLIAVLDATVAPLATR